MNYKHYKRLKALGFPLNNFSMSMVQAEKIGDTIHIKDIGTSKTVSPSALLYVGSAVARNPEVQQVLASAGLLGIGVTMLGAMIYTIKTNQDYTNYQELCIENNLTPLSKPEFNHALKVLKNDYKFKKLKLKIDYKNKKKEFLKEIRGFPWSKRISEETYDDLIMKYKANKSDYKAAKKKLKEDYLNYRKSNYGHFYY